MIIKTGGIMIKLKIYLTSLKFEVDNVEQFLLINELAVKHGLQREQNELIGSQPSIYVFIYDLTFIFSEMLIS